MQQRSATHAEERKQHLENLPLEEQQEGEDKTTNIIYFCQKNDR